MCPTCMLTVPHGTRLSRLDKAPNWLSRGNWLSQGGYLRIASFSACSHQGRPTSGCKGPFPEVASVVLGRSCPVLLETFSWVPQRSAVPREAVLLLATVESCSVPYLERRLRTSAPTPTPNKVPQATCATATLNHDARKMSSTDVVQL